MAGNENALQSQNDSGGNMAYFMSAAASFHDAVTAAWPSPEAERRVMEAFEKYSATLEQAGEASEAAARYADYFRSIQEAFSAPEARAHLNNAFRHYVADLKYAWSTVDPDAIAVEELSAIAQGMSWVSGIVGVVQRAAGG